MAKGNTGWERSEEYRQKMRERLLASPAHKASLVRLHESNKGRKASAEHKKKISDANKGKVFTEEHKQRIRAVKRTPEAIARNVAFHTGRKRSDEARRNMSAAHQASPKTAIRMANLREFNTGKHVGLGVPKSEAHKQSLRASPRVRAHMLRLRQDKGPTSLELFIAYCLTIHGGHRFEHEAEIPGFSDLYGRHKRWDFLLPDKKIALELDGRYWHPGRPERNFAADCNPEAFHELYATILGWRVVRIPEAVLRKSKPYRLWLRERNQEQKEIKRACKPPRIRINLASKSIASKAAHFERVKARSLATAA